MSENQVNADPLKLPSNFGMLEDPDGHARITGPCGDTMEYWLWIKENRITKVSFTTDGCGSSIVSGSMAAQLAEGKNLKEASQLQQEDVLKALGGLPEASRHCALLAANTLKAAVANFNDRMKKESDINAEIEI
ncbi:MAG: iron-sulfur cluster assembly scaffold protein [Desulfobacterales bacterium]|nr:iron-sulfur cluster assembly scaffold protein [Desulfobacterales bacterium]